MQLYVCGFAFHLTTHTKRLLLYRDGDFLNGVPGRVAGAERGGTAMKRAWLEKTGVLNGQWTHVGEFLYPDREVIFYKSYFDVTDLDKDKHNLLVVNPDHLAEYDVHESLRWLVPLCLLDHPPAIFTAEW
jgi:hypothetical protein